MPQDMRDANIVTRATSVTNNYRGISLLSIFSKVFACVTLNHLYSLALRLSLVIVWLQSWKVHNRNDLPSAAGSVESSSNHCFLLLTT